MRVSWLLLACLVAVFLGLSPGSDALSLRLGSSKVSSQRNKDTKSTNVKTGSKTSLLGGLLNSLTSRTSSKTNTQSTNLKTSLHWQKSTSPGSLAGLLNSMTSKSSSADSTSLKTVLSSLNVLKQQGKAKVNVNAGLALDPSLAENLKKKLSQMGSDVEQCLKDEFRCTTEVKTKMTEYFGDFLKKLFDGDASNKNSKGLGGILSKLLGVGSSSSIQNSAQLQIQLKNLKLPSTGLLGSTGSTVKLKVTLNQIGNGGTCLRQIEEKQACDDSTKEKILTCKMKMK